MPKKYTHLTVEDRTVMHTPLQQGVTPAASAASLGRPRSCGSRERARKGWKAPPAARSSGRPAMAGGYASSRATLRARTLSVLPRVTRRLVVGTPRWHTVSDGVHHGVSPEQGAGTLGRMHDPIRLCHDTMYHALDARPHGALRPDMMAWLRVGHTTRRPRARGVERRGQIPDRTRIDLRPADSAARLGPGHWDGEHSTGAGTRSPIGTRVERKTRSVAVVTRCTGTAPATPAGVGTILHRVDVDRRRSRTYDQGREMAHHAPLTEDTGITVYGAHPHRPWERGQHEHTTGVLRQYLPKGSDRSAVSQQALDDIAWTRTTRPRKS